MRRGLLPLLSLLSLLVVSCQTTDGGASDKAVDPDLGSLEDRVEQYRDAQQNALEQFQSAGQQLLQWTSAGAADWQAAYASTVQQNNDAIEAAIALSTAIAAVEESAATVFQDWQVEVDVYTDAQLKADSQAKLGETWQGYESMMQVVHQSETKMDTVLSALNSNKEYFSENLSATGVTNRQTELNVLRADITTLVYKMTIALDSSESFLDSIE